MKKILVFVLAVLLSLGLFGCAEKSTTDDGTTVLISAAASLTSPLTEIAEAYEAANPGVTITLNFGSSGALQAQIENGAPADVFFSAANKQMDALEDQDLIDATSRLQLLKNEIVLIVPADSALDLTSFEQAAGDTVATIAVGDPASVPAGQYAEDTFTYLNLWDAVSEKAVLASDVKQVLNWIAAGEADCGVVYQTDAALEEGVSIVASAPDGSHKAIEYPVAIVTASQQQSAAADFIAYVQSDEATAIFENYGFLPY